MAQPTVVPALEQADLAPSALAALTSAVELLAQLGFAVVRAQAPAAPALADVGEVAAALGVSTWSVYRWASQGRIPSVGLGRKRSFEIDKVVAALRRDAVEPPAQPIPQALPVRPAPSTRTRRPPRRERVAPSPSGTSHQDRLAAAVALTKALAE